jgi:uncharacterized membrane protein YphA (DoxX/SURF4 family)
MQLMYVLLVAAGSVNPLLLHKRLISSTPLFFTVMFHTELHTNLLTVIIAVVEIVAGIAVALAVFMRFLSVPFVHICFQFSVCQFVRGSFTLMSFVLIKRKAHSLTFHIKMFIVVSAAVQATAIASSSEQVL